MSVILAGVGPDAEIVTNENGAKQSSSPYRFDLLPPVALAEVARVLKHGADKYGDTNWHGIVPSDHLNHALQHFYAYLAGDGQEGEPREHLTHAACRLLFAMELLARGTER